MSRSPPFRALFTAYDQVLDKYGIKKETDQIYFRFLLRMRDFAHVAGRKQSISLFEQFQTLLQQQKIFVDWTPLEQEGDEETGHAPESESEPELEPVPEVESRLRHNRELVHAARPQVATRRASFSSYQDTITQPLPQTFQHRRSRSADHDAKQRVVHFEAAAQAPVANEWDDDSTGLHYQPSNRGRVNGHRERNQIATHSKQPRQLSKAPRQVRQGSKLPLAADYDEDASDLLSNDNTKGEVADAAASRSRPAAPPSNPALAQWAEEQRMEEEARELQYRFIAGSCHRIFLGWLTQAKRLEHDRHELYTIAAQRDEQVLLGVALSEWKSKTAGKLAEKLAAQETENFFTSLERRAEQARDMYLLTKAFTHWAQCAEEEVYKASVARRFILQTKLFNAWRDITAVYELKARRLPLSKFLRVWRKRAADVSASRQDAQDFHRSELSRRVYHDWFWRFCDRKAPAWQGSQVRAKSFSFWLERFRYVDALDTQAFQHDEERLASSSVAMWKRQTALILDKSRLANDFRRARLLKSSFRSLHLASVLSPSQFRTHSTADHRVLRSAFQTWHYQTDLSVQASSWDRARLLKRSIKDWNDSLRVSSIITLQEDHLLAQCLRSLAIESRLRLAQRVANERHKEQTLRLWRWKTDSIAENLDRAERALATSMQARLFKLAFTIWRTKAQGLKLSNLQADQHRVTQLGSLALEPWKVETSHLRQLELRAKRARFYVLAHRPLQAWRTAMIQKRKDRRREAYAVFRAQVKRRTADRILTMWRSRLDELRQYSLRASISYDRHIVQVAQTYFTRWHTWWEYNQQHEVEAMDFRAGYLVQSTFQYFRERLAELEDLGGQASALVASRNAESMRACFRSLNWALFQVRARYSTADGLAERNLGRNARSLVRVWHQRMRQQRGLDVGESFSQTRDEVPLTEEEDFPIGNAAPARTGASGVAETPLALDTPRSRLTVTPGLRRSFLASGGAASTIAEPRVQTSRLPMRTIGRASAPSTPAPATTGRGTFMKRLKARTPAPATVGGYGRELGMVREDEEGSPLRGRGT